MLSSGAVDAVWEIQTENRGETHRHWDLGVRPLPSGQRIKAVEPDLEALRQAEFREQRGVEKGHHPRHPVGPQVQHM
jgi:hypothetical protein